MFRGVVKKLWHKRADLTTLHAVVCFIDLLYIFPARAKGKYIISTEQNLVISPIDSRTVLSIYFLCLFYFIFYAKYDACEEKILEKNLLEPLLKTGPDFFYNNQIFWPLHQSPRRESMAPPPPPARNHVCGTEHHDI